MPIACRLLGLTLGLATVCAFAHPALACDEPPEDAVAACSDYVKIPSDVPSDLPAFYWSPSFALEEIGGAAAHLARVDGAAPEELAFHLVETTGGLWVQPDAPLVPGASYTFTRTASCVFQQKVTREISTSFKAVPAAALAKSFGKPKSTEPIMKQISYAVVLTSLCGGEPEIHPVTARSVTLTPSETAPILPALPFVPVYRVRVDDDDRFSYGVPTEGNGLELQAYCGPAEEIEHSPLKPGKHKVQLYASYPASGDYVLSEPITIDLSCSAAPSSPAAVAVNDAKANDANDGGGCTMTVSSPLRTSGAFAILAVGLAALRRRKRA